MFRTGEGVVVPAVTAEQMREVDRVAVEVFGLTVLQMMENAGRNLAENVLDLLGEVGGEIAVLAGSGGNGGGGLCCARHLHNHGFQVHVILSKEAGSLSGPAQNQLQILRVAGVEPVDPARAEAVIRRARLVVDALIGYSLRGTPRGRTADLIKMCNRHASTVLSLDVPSGLDATTGEAPGLLVRPQRTLTLALPKAGLRSVPGDLYLGDIGIPPEVFRRIGISVESPFKGRHWVRLEKHSDARLDWSEGREGG